MFTPLFVNIDGWKIAVFGGGNVGLRRTKFFLKYGAEKVFVIAKEFKEELIDLGKNNPNVELIKANIPDDMDKVEKIIEFSDMIVIASSDRKANEVIREVARTKGKLINDATEALKGNVIVPFISSIFEGGIIIAVSSLGRSGIAARRSLEKAVNALEADKELKALYKAMKEIKAFVKENVKDPKKRVSLYFRIERDPCFRKEIEKGNWLKAYQVGISIIKSEISEQENESK